MNEATIQCEIYFRLRLLGYKVISEYKLDHSRVDLAVFVKNKLRLLIEVKNYKKEYINKKTRQYKKYDKLNKKYNINFIYYLNRYQVESTINYIREKYPLY